MKKKVIAVAGFKGGVGKSTISNFLAEKLGNSIIFNLDSYQDASDFNTTETINLTLADDISLKIKSKNSDFYVIDAGGFDDERLRRLTLDLLILPTRTDYRSIKTTIDSAATIMSHISKQVPILLILNEYENEKELNNAVEIIETVISFSSNFDAGNLTLFALKKSNAIKTASNKKMSLKELLASNALAYKSINEQFDELASEVLSIIQGAKNG